MYIYLFLPSLPHVGFFPCEHGAHSEPSEILTEATAKFLESGIVAQGVMTIRLERRGSWELVLDLYLHKKDVVLPFCVIWGGLVA